ncbi:anti-phage defense-associated sirtuin Dsr1 [Enterobacter kobei]|uniref:anti-phage defense-associated sirtuin Dsr1 n=1 Tax=Enterobacter kobei TaxID=208224 RepID=UPI000642CB46|nr:anti-phage defense-associated sirtuin Dsr1 [Enterobacter kobei]KLQ93029.1 hypothetical protein ABR29_02300 [Enterobacter kobei]KUQ02706.1 hypothetical protein AWI05_10650 [Enterobacter kobei]
MQFVTNGPDIPDSLLQAHEEGRVVFFCGAGISVPAKLPDFKELVEEIFKRTSPFKTPEEEKTFKNYQYDATLNLLEHRLPEGRVQVRQALVSTLKRHSFPKSATETHAALLCLSKTHDNKMRLVTTNFDSLFELAAKRIGHRFPIFSAPMLPVPKNSRWDGLVHLHGAITPGINDTELNRLVVTSGDFGQAYLTERWAARFVSELFRNYVVCFVGYGINDPVLRYMMDALAADKLQGETTLPAWAFASYTDGEKDNKRTEWLAKGVTPVLYEVGIIKNKMQDHSLLHKTLHTWAETYRDGVTGKERIVVDYALSLPSRSTVQDDFVGRMLWALSDKSGLPARRLAEYKPAPSLEWYFSGLEEKRYRQSDLERFGMKPRSSGDEALRFSLICRPSPYHLSPFMMLFAGDNFYTQWDDIMHHLASWLIKYLNEPRLLISLAKSSGELHPLFRRMISDKIAYYSKLEHESKSAELEEIISNSPMAIPCQQMKTLWQLFLSQRVQSPFETGNIISWKQRLGTESLTATLRFELRELLAPRIRLNEPYNLKTISGDRAEQAKPRMSDFVQWELVLSLNHARSMLDVDRDENFRRFLPELFDDLELLLKDALALMDMMSDDGKRSDYSYWHLPSISPHPQNLGHKDWTLLIELLRDAWLSILDTVPQQATQLAIGWYSLPYPVFKRLAFFAASRDMNISAEQWCHWLTDQNAKWLWSVETSREVYRLLVLRGNALNGNDQQRLEEAILTGPPDTLTNIFETDEQLQAYLCGRIWRVLAKLQSSGLELSEAASIRLQAISAKYPTLKLAANEHDEFSIWFGDTGEDETETRIMTTPAPEDWLALVEWLQEDPPEQWLRDDDGWRDVCTIHFEQSVKALRILSEQSIWPVQRWREALQAWSRDEMPRKTWESVAPLIKAMSDEMLNKILPSLSWWLECCSKTLSSHQNIFRDVCKHILSILSIEQADDPKNSVDEDNPVSGAINHPVGHITEALVNHLFSNDMEDNNLLPDWLKPSFTMLCEEHTAVFRHGRVILSANVIPLLRIDPSWTKSTLLPLFKWENEVEARSAWAGFLWSPRLYKPLFVYFKEDFLATASRLDRLKAHSNQYISVLTYVALDMAEDFTENELSNAFNNLTNEGLETVLQTLTQALTSSGEQLEAYWVNRIVPFWITLWPKSTNRITPRISELLVQLILSAGAEFPAAWKLVKGWIQPVEHLHYPLYLLAKSNKCSTNPEEALELLDALVRDQAFPPDEVKTCLEQILSSDSHLEHSQQYSRIYLYLRRKGIING